MKNVAIYLTGVQNIDGGGGAERFFADFFSIYQSYPNRKFKLFFCCDKMTLNTLKSLDKLKDANNIIVLKNLSNRFKKYGENIDFRLKLKKSKIDILHCANYGRQDFDRLMSIKRNNTIKILNIVDCQIPYILNNINDIRSAIYNERYIYQPNKIKFQGVFSWYQKFIEFSLKNKIYNWNPLQKNINSRFTDTHKFKPNHIKKNIIVFASRMHFQKRPDWFIKAVSILRNDLTLDLTEWQFFLFGDGNLSQTIDDMIIEMNLDDIIHRQYSKDLADIFSKSKCFISTQDFENFPSLSMMEAMASGNAIIARNVGQTNLMIKDNKNGYLLSEDTPKGLARKIKKYILLSNNDKINMQNQSLKLIKEVHNPKSFILQIEEFWITLLEDKSQI
jgi:glycosyltransferase involved in cell wall biosynthesis